MEIICGIKIRVFKNCSKSEIVNTGSLTWPVKKVHLEARDTSRDRKIESVLEQGFEIQNCLLPTANYLIEFYSNNNTQRA